MVWFTLTVNSSRKRRLWLVGMRLHSFDTSYNNEKWGEQAKIAVDRLNQELGLTRSVWLGSRLMFKLCLKVMRKRDKIINLTPQKAHP